MKRQKHKIFDKKSGVTVTFETDGPPDWGNNMPNPDLVTETELEKDSDVTFDLWYQLRKSPYAQGNTLLYIDSVVSYCFDVNNHCLLVVRKSELPAGGLTAVFMSADALIAFGADYAPDKAEDTFSLLKRTDRAIFNAAKTV